MMWTWASETEWTRLEWPEKALYTDVTLKNCGNAMALRFSVYKTEVTSHLESGEALCIWVGQRTIARTSHPGEQEEDWKVILTQQAMITGLPKSVESRARRKGREGSAHNRMLHCFLKRNFSPSLCRSWPRSPHPLQRKVLRPGHGGHGGCSPSPWVWCSARPFVPPSHSLCYQHTRPSLSAGSRPRPSPLPSLTATAWEDEGRTPAFSLRCFCSQKLLSPEKPQEVLEEKIFQVWRVREEVPWEVTTSCLAENLLERGLRCPVPAAHRNCAHQQSDRAHLSHVGLGASLHHGEVWPSVAPTDRMDRRRGGRPRWLPHLGEGFVPSSRSVLPGGDTAASALQEPICEL
uniref:zinc finger protein 74-like isoform X4 n=1 Tax=Halichoerus grypus TaxID=9711 RepID=UPI001659A7EC|nr:zinc finger protein 74-like isoform X4 [Halichoerus grypus]